MPPKQLRLPALKSYQALALIAIVAMFGLMGFTLVLGSPRPVVHDEFSYLLMGETFAMGQWARPAHPMGEYLATFHVLQEPTYASKYFPLLGFFLAFGFVFGAPIIGVWLSVVLMGWSFYYASRAVAKPTLACVVALWGTLHFGVLTYWGHSFWGGTPIAIAGALMLGGVLHQRRRLAPMHAGMLALGLVLTLLSRPFEGFFFGLPLGLFYLGTILRRGRRQERWRGLSLGLGLPTFGVLLGLAFLGYYNLKVTGDATQFPHSKYQETYFPEVNRFAWEEEATTGKVKSTAMRPAEFERFAGNGKTAPSSLADFVTIFYRVFPHWSYYYLSWPVLVAFAAIALTGGFWRRPVEILLLGLLVLRWPPLLLAGSNLHAHYTAAWASVSVLLVAMGSRLLWTHRALLRKGADRWLAWLWPSGLLVPSLLLASAMLITGFQTGFRVPVSWSPNHWKFFADHRDAVAANAISRDPFRSHLILVSYDPNHLIHQEWVYNGADPDADPVVWARDPGEGNRTPLLEYYKDNYIWTITVGRPMQINELKLLREPVEALRGPLPGAETMP